VKMNAAGAPVAWRTRLSAFQSLLLPSVAALLAAYFLATTIVGLIKSYTPVPFWDMWDGYLNFYVRVLAGDYSAWWEKHNNSDHRIVFSRVFFWIDLEFFGGSSKFLIALNLLLAALIAGAFSLLARQVIACRSQRLVFALAALAACVGWIQWQNLAWAFQSQILAYPTILGTAPC